MNKTLKIFKCIGALAVMSIPYIVLVEFNRNAVSDKVLHMNSTFRFFSIIFGIQYLLSLIGTFLIFVRTIDHPENEKSGCLTLAFAGLSLIAFYKLNDFGDGWISGGNDPFSRLMHPEWSSFIFYLCLTVCLVQILFTVLGLVLGKITDD